jgi:hypothetical protein
VSESEAGNRQNKTVSKLCNGALYTNTIAILMF